MAALRAIVAIYFFLVICVARGDRVVFDKRFCTEATVTSFIAQEEKTATSSSSSSSPYQSLTAASNNAASLHQMRLDHWSPQQFISLAFFLRQMPPRHLLPFKLTPLLHKPDPILAQAFIPKTCQFCSGGYMSGRVCSQGAKVPLKVIFFRGKCLEGGANVRLHQ